MWISYVAVFLLFNAISVNNAQSNCSVLNKNVYIRHPTSLLIVEGNWSDTLIKIRTKFEDFIDQQWIFQPSSRLGLFNILHVGRNDTALDVDLNYDPETDTFNATQKEFTDELTQQWFIHSDGTIVNGAANNHVLKIKDGNYVPLNYLVVGPRTGDPSEVFELEYDED